MVQSNVEKIQEKVPDVIHTVPEGGLAYDKELLFLNILTRIETLESQLP